MDLAASCSSAVPAALFAVAFAALMHDWALAPLAVMMTEALPLLEVALTVVLSVVISWAIPDAMPVTALRLPLETATAAEADHCGLCLAYSVVPPKARHGRGAIRTQTMFLFNSLSNSSKDIRISPMSLWRQVAYWCA